MDLLDTAWCPVCDRQIPPAILLAPPELRAIPGPQPIKTRGGTIKAAPGSVSQRRAGGHARSKSSFPPSEAPSQPPSPPGTKAGKPKTYISQAPTPLYCSPECELADSISHRLTLSIPPSPSSPPLLSHSHSRLHPPASPILVSGSSSSSDAGGSWGSPFSTNSDYFAYLEGRPRRQSNATNTGSSAESLSSLHQAAAQVTVPSRPPLSRAATAATTTTASRSRRPSSSSSLAPRPQYPVPTGYAASPPRPSLQQSYGLSFTRAPSSTCSPGSSPPVISRLQNGHQHPHQRERSSSRASSTLRSARSDVQPPLSESSSSASSLRSIIVTPTPRPEHQMRPSSHRRPSHQNNPQQPPLPPHHPIESRLRESEDDQKDKQWWSWDRLPHYVPTYEAMSPPRREGEGRAGTSAERKRMFYFEQ